MHKAYKAEDVVDGVAMKEFRGVPGARPDFVDFKTKTIFELKPHNPRGIKQGTKQVANYKRLFDKKYGGNWATKVEYY